MNGFFNLFDFDFAKAFNFEEGFAGCAVDRLMWSDGWDRKVARCTYSDSVEAISFQLGDICSANAVRLDAVNVYDERLVMIR